LIHLPNIHHLSFIIILYLEFWIFRDLFNESGKNKYFVYVLQISENLRDLGRFSTTSVIHEVGYFDYQS